MLQHTRIELQQPITNLQIDDGENEIAVQVIDEQTIAQAELSAYIDQQAQTIAPEPEIQFIDLDGFYTYEAQTEGKTIATITHHCATIIRFQNFVVYCEEE